ncbi:MAG: hypothetical protein LC676_19820 [Loktanella sp.]|nr:hypothetical protein [Loktanella sp.]
MSDQQIIVIKKSDEHDDHGHHGGGWKVAYADFMTAMMAFFLLMWQLRARRTNFTSRRQGGRDSPS